ncbi:MAG: hypothetical protein HC899_20500 [Leptolyngbyaceae cyanobacterium SM1_4_3]|nr:hypothetical protein [Leptolyngbyaceae cyanobacterium SM1_4_3]
MISSKSVELNLWGMATYPFIGEDVQAWISRTRSKPDIHRERTLYEELRKAK